MTVTCSDTKRDALYNDLVKLLERHGLGLCCRCVSTHLVHFAALAIADTLADRPAKAAVEAADRCDQLLNVVRERMLPGNQPVKH